MKHRPPAEEQDDLLRPRLVDMIDPRHELVKLTGMIDWEVFERAWSGFFPSHRGRPTTPPRLVADLAQETGIDLRQSYARLSPRLALQVGRYAHAKQFKRMRKALKNLKGYTGRVMRDLRRHLQDIPEGELRQRITAKLALVSHLLHQPGKGGGKIYALHAPEVDCIAKGKGAL